MPRPEAASPQTPLALVAAQPRTAQPDHVGQTDPLIQALLDRLPKVNAIWSVDDRAKWLSTAASVFGLVYKTTDGDRNKLAVTVLKEDSSTTTAPVGPGFLGQ